MACSRSTVSWWPVTAVPLRVPLSFDLGVRLFDTPERLPCGLREVAASLRPDGPVDLRTGKGQPMNRNSLVSVAVIVVGCLLIAYDQRYGPKDDVMYLWIFPVLLLMAIAACVLLYQVAARIIHWARSANDQ